MPANKVFVLDEKYTGRSVQEKYTQISPLVPKEADMLLTATLDEIAWFLNLRGSDIEFNPIFFSYLIFFPQRGEEKARSHLYIQIDKTQDESVAAHLLNNEVAVYAYELIFDHLRNYVEQGKKICIDESNINFKIYDIIKDNSVQKEAPIDLPKALKNPVEQAGMRECNVRDCAAIMKYFGWLEQQVNSNQNDGLDEFTGARQMDYFRTEGGELYKGPSFDTISSSGPNGAVIHYKPEKETALKLNNNEIYLLDSGG